MEKWGNCGSGQHVIRDLDLYRHPHSNRPGILNQPVKDKTSQTSGKIEQKIDNEGKNSISNTQRRETVRLEEPNATNGCVQL